MSKFGKHIKSKRLELNEMGKKLSQNKLSQLIEVEQSYLSKIERGVASKLSEEKILKLAEVLEEDPDYLLALGGKVSSDVLEIIQQRPMLFSRLVRAMKDMPEDVIESDHDFRQEQSRTNKLYEISSIGFFHIENEEINSAWSKSCPAILGLPSSSSPSLKTIKMALSPKSQQEFTKAENGARASLKPFVCELESDGSDGSKKFYRMWGFHEPHTNEDRIALLGLLQDVTEQVNTRKELRSAHEALSDRVQEQGQQLSMGIDDLKREIASRKLLESELREINVEVHRQKDQQKNYLKQSAFELRTLINRLASEEGQAEDSLSKKGVLSFLSTTINNMNDYFALEGGISLFPEAVNGRKYFDQMAQNLHSVHLNNNVSLQFVVSPSLPERLVVDPQRLEQVLYSVVNLLTHNTTWGNVQVTVDYIESRKELYIAIASPAATGNIAKETFYPALSYPEIYKPWPVATVGPIVDAFKGELLVSSAQNSGITVSVQIPSRVQAASMEQVAIDPEQPILVVEDDEYSCLYAKRLVEKAGYIVETASTGADALEKIQKKKYGLILLDIQLPDIDGVSVTRKVRSSDGWPNANTQIVAVTAHSTSEDRQRYKDIGIQNLIAKPFRREELQKLLSELSP